jgi:hypothetical protein
MRRQRVRKSGSGQMRLAAAIVAASHCHNQRKVISRKEYDWKKRTA